MGILLLLAIPLIALALNAGGAAPRVRDMSYYRTLYRVRRY